MSRLKRMVSILLITLILIGSFPAGVFAMEECTHENVDPYTGKCTNPDCEDPDFGYTASLTVDGNTSYYHLIRSEGGDTGVIDAANETGGTIRLFKDVKTSSLEFREKKFVLDLNGHSMEHNDENGDSIYIRVLNGANLTITDSSDGKAGKILHGLDFGDDENAVYVDQSSECTVEKVTIECTEGNAAYVHGELTVEGGTFAGGAAVIDVDIWMIDEESGRGKVTIKDGSFSGNIEVIGTLQIDGGTFSNDGHQVDVDGNYGDEVSKVVLNGGNFPDGLRLTGVFNAGNVLADNKYFWNDGKQLSPAQTENDFEGNITIAGPCEHPTSKISDETGICADCQTQFAASVTVDAATTYYADLDSAVAEALKAGAAKITLLADIDYSTKTEGKKYLYINDTKSTDKDTVLTLDLNGKTLKGEQFGIALNSCILILEDSDESDEKGVIMNGDLPENPDKAYAGINMANTCNLTINGGTIIGSSIGVKGGSMSSITINGGKISGLEMGVDAFGGTLTITGGDISSEYKAVNSLADTTTITGGKFSSKDVALDIHDGEATVTGGEFTGSIYGAEQVKGVFGVGSDASGAVFTDKVNIVPHDDPEIKVTANDLLAEGTSFWADKDGDGNFETMLAPSDEAMTIEGKIIVRTSCTHPAEKISHDTGICGGCNLQVYVAKVSFNGGEEQLVSDLNSEVFISNRTGKAEVTLISDIVLDGIGLWVDGRYGGISDIVLNLNGHKITGGSVSVFAVMPEGSLVINGSGTIIVPEDEDAEPIAVEVTERATAELNDITIEYADGGKALSVENGGILKAKNVVVNSVSEALCCNGNAEFTDCTLEGTDEAVYIGSGTVTLKDTDVTEISGDESGNEIAVMMDGGMLNINGGTIRGDNAFYVSSDEQAGTTVNLSGCTVYGAVKENGSANVNVGENVKFPEGYQGYRSFIDRMLKGGYALYDAQTSLPADMGTNPENIKGNLITKTLDLSHAEVRFASEDEIFDGNEHKPALSVLFGGLTLGEELYSVSYEGGFVNVGSYKVVVTPAENSSAVGNTSAYFTILPDIGLIESITKENVTSSDEDAVREVLESIKEADLTNVSDEMKEELQKISEKCEELINVVEEVQKKGQEIGEVLNGLKPENVTPEDEEAVKDAIKKLDELISGTNITPEEKAELEEAKKDAEEIIKEIGVQKEVIKAKEDAEKDLQDEVKPEEYRDSEKAQIGKILSDAKEALKKATTTEEVEKIVSETKAKLDTLKTDSELKAEELVKAKEEAAETIADMVDPEEYRPAQKAEIDAIRKEASEAISAAKSQEEVEKIVSETKARLEAVKTDKELTAEELIPGDADGNGSVDAKDATQILRYINGKACIFTQEGADTEKLLKAADVDGSGDVDAKDATQILRYINGKTSLFDRM